MFNKQKREEKKLAVKNIKQPIRHDYENEELKFDCSLEDILNGKDLYYNYYAMSKYLIDNCDKDYILKLAKDNEFLKNETPSIYYKTKEYVHRKTK